MAQLFDKVQITITSFLDIIVGSFRARIDASSITANRTYTAPNANGTIARLEDFTANLAIVANRPSVSVTASKTFALSDSGTYQWCTNTTAITETIPTNAVVAFPLDTEIEVKKGGSGTLSIDATSGVTVQGDGGVSITLPFALTKGCTLKKLGTNLWILEGS